jgi:ketosteroid isomerase-like protein
MSDFLIAESAIRQLHARCADAVWRKDSAGFADCFAQDAEWKIAGMRMRGREAIKAQLEAFLEPLERVIMFFGVPILEVGKGTASGRTYVTERNKAKDGRTASTIGIYYERFVDQGDRWRFSWRHWMLHYIGPPDMSAPFYECQDYGPPPGMPGPDDPTTVRREFLHPGTTGSE